MEERQRRGRQAPGADGGLREWCRWRLVAKQSIGGRKLVGRLFNHHVKDKVSEQYSYNGQLAPTFLCHGGSPAVVDVLSHLQHLTRLTVRSGCFIFILYTIV